MKSTTAEGRFGGTALITGASGEIGAAIARELGSRGYEPILVARQKERLVATAEEIGEQHGTGVEVLPADLSRDEDILRVSRRVQVMDTLTMLVNNAGFGTSGRFAETDLGTLAAMIAVHVVAPTRLARAALPGMIGRGRGAIINVASPSAFVLFPGNTTCAAAKHYLVTLSQGLGLELNGSGIRVQALCPGFTHTGFHDTDGFRQGESASIPECLWMSPGEVVRRSLGALGRKQGLFVPGLINRLMYLGFRRLTASLARWMFRGGDAERAWDCLLSRGSR